jgi:hypothetical protein
MYLRVTRDRRGFENTFLVHNVQRGGKKHARILYWFRSPVEVRVGRRALDEEALRAIEASQPRLAFSWERILESRPAQAEPPPPPEPRPRGRRRDTGGAIGRRRVPSEAPAAAQPPQPAVQGAPAATAAGVAARRRGRRTRQAPPLPAEAPGNAGASPAAGQTHDDSPGGASIG